MQFRRCSSAVVRSLFILMMGAVLLGVPTGGFAEVHDPGLTDAKVLTDLESRAAQASPREQATLYADLADRMTVLASQQIAAGEMEAAGLTLLHMEACTEKLEKGLLQNSKGLKKTELLLHTTERRLHDLARSSSAEVRPQVQSALKRLDLVHTALLGVLFEK